MHLARTLWPDVEHRSHFDMAVVVSLHVLYRFIVHEEEASGLVIDVAVEEMAAGLFVCAGCSGVSLAGTLLVGLLASWSLLFKLVDTGPIIAEPLSWVGDCVVL